MQEGAVYQRREGHHSNNSTFFVLYTNIFFAATSISILFASMAPYILKLHGTHSILTYCFIVYTTGEALLGQSLQVLRDKQIKWPLLVFLFLGLSASGLWLLPYILQAFNVGTFVWILIISRFVAGLGRGGQTEVERTLVARYISVNERKRVMRHMSIAVALGYIAGPALGLASHHASESEFFKSVIDFNVLTAPGYFQGLMALLSMFFFLITFREREAVLPAPAFPGSQLQVSNMDREGIHFIETQTGVRINIMMIFVLLFIFFINNLSFILTETIIRPITLDYFKIGYDDSNLLFICVGIINLFAVLLLEFISEKINSKILVAFSLAMQIAGYFCLVDWEGELPLNRFLIGYGLVMLGFPITRISLLALYHHMLQHVSDRSLTGWIVLSGISSRILGPFWLIHGYYDSGIRTVFLGTAIMFGVAFLVLISTWPYLAPFKADGLENIDDEKERLMDDEDLSPNNKVMP
jgi:hypothetical protein